MQPDRIAGSLYRSSLQCYHALYILSNHPCVCLYHISLSVSGKTLTYSYLDFSEKVHEGFENSS